MPVIRLESLNDPRLTEYRLVSEPELVRARGLFVAEGRLVVSRLIGDGRYRLRSLLLSDAALAALEPVVRDLRSDPPIYVCGAADFLTLTGVNIHRGCLAVAERPPALDVLDVAGAAKTVVLLEGVANADNVGGIFRNAAAFAVDAVLLDGTCCDPLYRKAIRTSMAATLDVPFARVPDSSAGISALRCLGFQIAALTPRQPSSTLKALAAQPRPERLAVLLGAEDEGLSARTLELADVRVRVPIARGIDSLNVAVAAGIALSQLAPVDS
jgi:tRNA G18 (ribose-2'-O)-methylase SpoU